jgi:hypothetical protein
MNEKELKIPITLHSMKLTPNRKPMVVAKTIPKSVEIIGLLASVPL